jgi:hypothetical protein
MVEERPIEDGGQEESKVFGRGGADAENGHVKQETQTSRVQQPTVTITP